MRNSKSVPTGRLYIARIAGSIFAKVLKSTTVIFLLLLIYSCVSVSPMARQPLSAALVLFSRNIHFSLDFPSNKDLVIIIPPALLIKIAFLFSLFSFLKISNNPIIPPATLISRLIIPYKFKIIYYCVSNGWIAPVKCVMRSSDYTRNKKSRRMLTATFLVQF